MGIVEELQCWGPESPAANSVSRDEAASYCRQLARTHYENFPVVTWLLPRKLHQHFYNVYAFCRWADDLGDEVGNPAEALRLLSWWREGLQKCYAGRTRHPVFVALGETIRTFEIPREPFDDLISAFEQDQTVFEYQTFEELRDYCRRSADPVGRIVLRLCGEDSAENVALSDAICTGLQLTNFWQDVARDYDRGRVYLPAEDRDRFGYTAEDLRCRRTNESFIELLRFEVQRSREWLERGRLLPRRLPFRWRVDVELFALGGLKVLDRIAAMGYRVWEGRPVLTGRDFAALFFKALFGSLWPRRRAKSAPACRDSRPGHPRCGA